MAVICGAKKAKAPSAGTQNRHWSLVSLRRKLKECLGHKNSNMARIKRGVVSRRKHKKLLAQTKGYRGSKRKLVRVAKQAALHAGAYAYHGRKRRKRDMRRLWITRISHASANLGLPYSRFIAGLHKEKIALDRKILAELVLEDPDTFAQIVTRLKQ